MTFNFKKGNMDSIEGRVVVCAEFARPFQMKECEFHMLYGTSDRDAFLDRAETTGIPNNIKELALDAAELVNEEFPWYTLPLQTMTSEFELLALPEPIVIDAGKHRFPGTIQFALHKTMEKYQHHIHKLVRNGQLTTMVAPDETYKLFAGKELLNYINIKFINPMIYAKLEGKQEQAKRFQTKFLRFFSGSPYLGDINEICHRIMKGSTHQEAIKVIDLYAQKIVATHEEDFELADKVKNELARFR